MQFTRCDAVRAIDDEDELVRHALAAGYLPQAAVTRRTAVRNDDGEVRLVFGCADEAEFVGLNARLQRAGLTDLRQALTDRPGGYDAAFRPAAREEQASVPATEIVRE